MLEAVALLEGDVPFERIGGAAQIVEPHMDHRAFAPEVGARGCDQQHALDDVGRLREFAHADVADLHVVLQPQQDVDIADRLEELGRQLGLVAGGGLDQPAQLGRIAGPTAMERIDDRAFAFAIDAHQEMPGKGDAIDLPALSATSVDVENPESHRQSAPPVDDAHQIGVLQIVIGRIVAAIAFLDVEDFVDRGAAPVDRVGGAALGKPVGNVARQQGEMLEIAFGRDIRTVERCQCQRSLGEIDLAVGQLRQGFEMGARCRDMAAAAPASSVVGSVILRWRYRPSGT